MKILDTLKDFFAKGPQEPEVKEVEQKVEQKKSTNHHHNHGSSTT
jgi:hypothetical protein